MMNLANPDSRRALRSIIQAVIALVVIALAWWLAGRIQTEDGLREALRWALGIVGLGTFFYGLENTTRAFKLSVSRSGLDVEATGEMPPDDLTRPGV